MNIQSALQESATCQQFLRRYCDDRLKRNNHLSLRAITKKLGFNHAATLSLILNGKRNLAPKDARRVGNAMELPHKSKLLLEAMAMLESSNEDDGYFFEKIISELRNRPTYEVVSDTRQSDLGWVDYAVLCINQSKPLANSKNWSFSLPSWSVDSNLLSESVDKLLSANLLSGKKTRFDATSSHLTIPAISGKRPLLDFIRMAHERYQVGDPREGRSFSSYMVATTPVKVERAMGMIEEFRTKLGEMLEDPDGDTVYLLNIQLFDLVQSGQADN